LTWCCVAAGKRSFGISIPDFFYITLQNDYTSFNARNNIISLRFSRYRPLKKLLLSFQKLLRENEIQRERDKEREGENKREMKREKEKIEPKRGTSFCSLFFLKE
jgi:hypothetical protein